MVINLYMGIILTDFYRHHNYEAGYTVEPINSLQAESGKQLQFQRT